MRSTGPVDTSRDGCRPPLRRDVVPCLGTARDGRLRDRDVRRLGGRPDGSRPRWRRHERDVVGGRRGRRARGRVPLHDPHPRRRPVAHRPVRTPGHELHRQRHRLRPGRVRLGRRHVPDAELGRPRHLRDARRDLRADAAIAPAPSTTRGDGCDYLEDLGVSAVQVMPPFEFAGDISWGYNPAHLFAIESSYGGPGRVQGVHPRGARQGHRGHRRRRLQPHRPVRSRPVAVRRLGREAMAAASTSTTTIAP